MDVKGAFLKGILNKEAYVKQPKGFIDLYLFDHIFKLKKTLCRLKQAPSACYERLNKFLLEK